MTTARSSHLGAEYVTCRQGLEAALWEGVGVLLGLGLHTGSGFSALRSRGQAAAERLGEGSNPRERRRESSGLSCRGSRQQGFPVFQDGCSRQILPGTAFSGRLLSKAHRVLARK